MSSRMSEEREFVRRIEALDLSLFDAIASQSSDADRRAWLAVQRSLRRATGYVYLEIGSHLGGSIQQHIVDPWCRAIVSIDKRPLVQADDRGQNYHYESNSTERMLDNLRGVSASGVAKLTCFDSDASEVAPAAVSERANFCFIDGEHRHDAVVSDFHACYRFAAPDAAICFHDAFVVHRAIAHVVGTLRERAVSFEARKLGGSTFAIFLGECPARNDERIRAESRDGHRWLRERALRDRIPKSVRSAARRLKSGLR